MKKSIWLLLGIVGWLSLIACTSTEVKQTPVVELPPVLIMTPTFIPTVTFVPTSVATVEVPTSNRGSEKPRFTKPIHHSILQAKQLPVQSGGYQSSAESNAYPAATAKVVKGSEKIDYNQAQTVGGSELSLNSPASEATPAAVSGQPVFSGEEVRKKSANGWLVAMGGFLLLVVGIIIYQRRQREARPESKPSAQVSSERSQEKKAQPVAIISTASPAIPVSVVSKEPARVQSKPVELNPADIFKAPPKTGDEQTTHIRKAVVKQPMVKAKKAVAKKVKKPAAKTPKVVVRGKIKIASRTAGKKVISLAAKRKQVKMGQTARQKRTADSQIIPFRKKING